MAVKLPFAFHQGYAGNTYDFAEESFGHRLRAAQRRSESLPFDSEMKSGVDARFCNQN
jgi:hypothetical protein